jgi:YVTN family beta-propeller protein
VELGNNPHGLASAADGRTLFITTDGGRGEIIAFDTVRQAIAWRVAAGANLHEPAVSADGRHLYVPELRGGKVYVVDVIERRVASEIPLRERDGVTPLNGLHIAQAGARGRFIYQTAISSRALARIDTATRRVERVYALTGKPRPVALLPDESKIYVQFSQLNGFIELDLKTGAETARIAWPEPAGLPETATKCHGIAITADGTELWAASNLDRAVRVYSLRDLKPIARIDLGGQPHWIAFSPDGATVYVTDRQLGRVLMIDRAARRVLDSLVVGERPTRVVSLAMPVSRR